MAFWVGISAVLLLFIAIFFPFLALLWFCPCPRRAKQRVFAGVIRWLLPFRYDIRVKGLSAIPRTQGVLFLPNHPALVDPIIMLSLLVPYFRVRPVAAEAQFARSKRAFSTVEALPVPDFHSGAANSYQKHLMETLFGDMVGTLEQGRSILMYPAGRLMKSGEPFVEIGASATFELLQRRGEKPWRVVFVNTHGLWGSRFSNAFDAKQAPNAGGGIKRGICELLMNCLLFMPKRRVDITFEEPELPSFSTKAEVNAWIGDWQNKFGAESLPKPGEPGYVRGKGLVPSSCCSSKSVREPDANQCGSSSTSSASQLQGVEPAKVREIQGKLAKHLGVPVENLGLEQNLTFDLGLDSIQLGEMLGWLDEQFDARGVAVSDLLDVASVVHIASGVWQPPAQASGSREPPKGWFETKPRPPLNKECLGNTLPEAFIRNATRMRSSVCCGDDTSGVVTYGRVLLAAMLVANFLKKDPRANGRVGVFLPATAGVGIILLGVMLAGCTPVLINHTVGRASLEHVLKTTNLRMILTSLAVFKKLGPEVDISCLLEKKDLIVFFEDVKANKFGGFGTLAKISAMRTAKKSAESIIKLYGLDKRSGDEEAVVLFTSGSEAYPKGVQLTHTNVLSNVRGMLQAAEMTQDDVVFGCLPPFHSFGFTGTTMCPFIAGVKVAYYPKPTEYLRIAREMDRWKPTLYLGTPTFVNGVLQASKAARSKAISGGTTQKGVAQDSRKVSPAPDGYPWMTASLRICITGAEKTPDDLFALAKEHEPNITIIEGYGITETSPVLTVNRPDKARTGVGWPLESVCLMLVEPDAYLEKRFNPLARCIKGEVTGDRDTRGIILASGPSVFGAPDATPPRGYLGVPLTEKNPFVQLDDRWWYDTGDLGYFDKDNGALVLAGRLKRFVKVAGEMISLVALEGALKEYALDDGRPWDNIEAGPVLAVEAVEQDGEKPIFCLVTTVDISLEDANVQLQAAGMPRIAKLTQLLDARVTFEARWAEQGTLPLLITGKTDYAAIKRAVVAAVTQTLL